MNKAVSLYTLGCKVNQYESERIASEFADCGFEVKDASEPADVYIVNTCTVTRLADRKSRQFARRARRTNPEALVVVIGCYPQVQPDVVHAMPEVDLVLDNTQKHRVVEHVLDRMSHGSRPPMSTKEGESPCVLLPGSKQSQRTRSLLKIQDGCDRFCSYCVIPHARGPVRSRPMKDIVEEAQRLVEAGSRELVLTGINTALYGTDRPHAGEGIYEVIENIGQIDGTFRIRLGSLEPTVVKADYVQKLLTCDKLCPHFHLALQSGSDRILQAMNRRYTVQEYREIVRVVREFDPLFALTTDIIAGFPGETEQDFQSTLAVVAETKFLKVHAFPYSPRPQTRAAQWTGDVAPAEKKQRVRRLSELADRMAAEYLQALEGRQVRVLPEEVIRETPQGTLWRGRTDSYVPVYALLKDGQSLSESFLYMRAGKLYRDGISAAEEGFDEGLHIL